MGNSVIYVRNNSFIKSILLTLTNDWFNFQNYNDELEKLRAEVRRYRLELQNRDANFNRVFTEQQPLIVDPRAGMIGVSSSQILSSRQSIPSSQTHVSPLAIQGRERSFSYDIVQGFEETVKFETELVFLVVKTGQPISCYTDISVTPRMSLGHFSSVLLFIQCTCSFL